jgi:hypothetical protein
MLQGRGQLWADQKKERFFRAPNSEEATTSLISWPLRLIQYGRLFQPVFLMRLERAKAPHSLADRCRKPVSYLCQARLSLQDYPLTIRMTEKNATVTGRI